MSDGSRFDPGLFDHLIDAEREALARSGRKVGKIALIKALRDATGLGLREAKESVELYLGRRGGAMPTASTLDRSPSWIDDLLDAERASAARDDRAVTKLLLIKALREASGLGLAQAKRAVEHYLERRGGSDLPMGSSGTSFFWMTVVIAATVGVLAWAYYH